jgi:hypothetical protein
MNSIVLATEDVLSEQAGLRIAAEAGLLVGQQLRRNGSGYLKSRIPNFCKIASFQPVVVIADLDQVRCPSQLLVDWLGRRERPDDLVIRVAVREIESWLMADHQAMRRLLGRRAGKLPREPEALLDPKGTLLNLARHAPRDVREDLLPPEGAIASQGLGFNPRRGNLIRTDWSPARAAERSPSLRKTRERLRELAQRMDDG